jgi:hypothetical protein
MIDEKLVGFVRPTQCLQKRRAEMTDDRVVVADAGLIAEFANAWCAGLSGDVVERRARQIEEQGVERLVDQVARIALQIVQTYENTRGAVAPGDPDRRRLNGNSGSATLTASSRVGPRACTPGRIRRD